MGRRAVAGSLFGLVLLMNFSRTVLAPLVAPLGDAVGASAGTVGVLVTIAWVGNALPRVPAGYLLTLTSRVRVVLGAAGLLVVGAAGLAIASGVRTVAVSVFLLGVASGTYFVAANPLLSELFPERVGTVLGLHGTAGQLGAVGSAPVVVVALAIGSWRVGVAALAVGGVLATAAFAASVDAASTPAAGREDRALLAAARAQWRVVLTGVVLVGGVGFVWNGVFNFYVPYLLASGTANGEANLLLTVAFGAGVPAFALTGRLTDAVAPVGLALTVLWAFTAGLIGVTLVDGLLAYAAVSAVLGYSFYSTLPVVDTYLLGSLPDAHRASAYAVYSGSMTLLQAGGSALVGTLVETGIAYDRIFRGLALALAALLVTVTLLGWLGRLPRSATAQ